MKTSIGVQLKAKPLLDSAHELQNSHVLLKRKVVINITLLRTVQTITTNYPQDTFTYTTVT